MSKSANISAERRKLYRQIALSIGIIALLLFLFIPLGSTNPDGLDKTAESLGVESIPLWEGLFPEYSVALIANPWISTFVAGVMGIVLVFAFMYLVSKIASLQRFRVSVKGQKK
ncbi:MAG: PDGLE domain-containing protein [Candidatus Atabeyarchaeum deiterrae]